MAFNPINGSMLKQKEKARAPHPALVAGALAKHLAKMVGAESPTARKVVFDEVQSFAKGKATAGQELTVNEIATLQKSLRKKLLMTEGYAAGFSSRPGTGVKINPTPTSGLDPGMLPNITEDYFVGFKKRMDDAETAKHRKWDFKGRGRHRDLLQAKRNDPWAMLIKDDCEKYSNEDDENKVADHGKKQGFRRTLDGQVGELNAQRKKDRDDMHQEWRDNDAEYADWQRRERARLDGIQANIGKLMSDQQEQLAQRNERFRKEDELRAQQQKDFRDQIARETEAQRQEDLRRFNYNKDLMRGYVEETKASEKLRKENAKAEERHALKAAREAAEQLQRSEDAYREEQERKKKRQESTTRNAVGKTWERRYVPTPVQESHQRAQTKKAYADEALFWAQKKWKRDDLIDGLNTQMEEGRVKKENSRREKNMWQAKFTAQANEAERQHQEEMRQMQKDFRGWKKFLDNQAQEFRYDQVYAPHSMTGTNRQMNAPHFPVLARGF